MSTSLGILDVNAIFAESVFLKNVTQSLTTGNLINVSWLDLFIKPSVSSAENYAYLCLLDKIQVLEQVHAVLDSHLMLTEKRNRLKSLEAKIDELQLEVNAPKYEEDRVLIFQKLQMVHTLEELLNIKDLKKHYPKLYDKSKAFLNSVQNKPVINRSDFKIVCKDSTIVLPMYLVAFFESNFNDIDCREIFCYLGYRKFDSKDQTFNNFQQFTGLELKQLIQTWISDDKQEENNIVGEFIIDAYLEMHRTGVSQEIQAYYLKILNSLKISKLDLELKRITEEEFNAIISQCPHVQSLNIAHNDLSDASLSILPQLEQLTYLKIRACKKVTDSAGAHIASIKNLTQLEASNSNIGDVFLSYFKDCTQLNLLDVGGTKVTDAGVQHLDRLTQLRFLSLSATSISGHSFLTICKLVNLQNLKLRRCTLLTDNIFPYLDRLQSLKYLDLTSCTNIGNQGILQLGMLQKLKFIDLKGCLGISETTVSDLEKTLQIKIKS